MDCASGVRMAQRISDRGPSWFAMWQSAGAMCALNVDVQGKPLTVTVRDLTARGPFRQNGPTGVLTFNTPVARRAARMVVACSRTLI